MTFTSSFVDALTAQLPERTIVQDPERIAPHLREWRDRWTGSATLMVEPASTEELAQIVRLCRVHKVPMVPQGGNTGLVGGGIPMSGELLISLSRLNKIRGVDRAGSTLTAEAGVILADVQKAAAQAERQFPLSLASEGSATIGGLAATNAGGVHVVRYGSMRDLVLGIEAVLPDGQVLNGLTGLRKDNTGYDLRHLLIGAEGTLGIITAATLKLSPRIRRRGVALVAVENPAAALDLLDHAQALSSLNAFELMSRAGLEMVIHHMGGRDPLETAAPWYVLVELADTDAQARPEEPLERLLTNALENDIITDGVVARSEAQAQALWHLREAMSEAQKPEGGSIKHDISVPVAAIPEFLKDALTLVERLVPGVRPVPFGHIGDGNIHFNLTQPEGMDRNAFLDRWEEVETAVHDLVIRRGGSISAEHGIGRLKARELARTADPAKLWALRAIKAALDPDGLMNPGRILDG